MKITTSSIIFGNSLIVLCSWSDIGTSSSLSNWPASTWMLFARFFIASCNSFWVFTCCQNNQSFYWCWKQKKSQLCIRPRYKRIWHVWRNSAASSQTTYRNNSQQSITLLIAVPRPMNIPASFAEAEQCRADCNSSNSTASFLIRGSTAFRSMLRLYNCIWRGIYSSDNDSVPWWPATAVIRGLDYQISPQILLKFCEQIRSNRGKYSLTIGSCSTRQVFLQVIELDFSFTYGSLLWTTLTSEYSLGAFFVYFDIQFVSFHKHATPHEHVGLIKHNDLNLPPIFGELQSLFTFDPFAQFSFNAIIDIVRTCDNEWVWIFIELSN